MQTRSGSLEQMKSLLNKQINQQPQLQFGVKSIKGGNFSQRDLRISQNGISNLTEHFDSGLASPKQKFIQMFETPQSAEFTFKEFGNRLDQNKNNHLNIQLAKTPFFHHQKSKSSSSMVKHLSMAITNEDASCCSRRTTECQQSSGNQTTKHTPQKRFGGQTALSQLSIFSHDISNFGDYIPAIYSNSMVRPETALTVSKKNTSISRYQGISVDNIEDQPLQSPVNHQRILSPSISIQQQPIPNVVCISGNRRSNSQVDQITPQLNSIQALISPIKKLRPQTGVMLTKENQNKFKEISSNQQNFFFKNIFENNIKKTINSASTAAGNSPSAKNTPLNGNSITTSNTSFFEPIEKRNIQAEVQQKKQLSLNQFVLIQNSAKVLRNNFLKSQVKSKQNSEISENTPGTSKNINSNQNLIEIAKSNKRILQEIIQEMESERKEFEKQIVESEQRNSIYVSQLQKIEKLIETKDIQLLTQQLLFLANTCLAVSDYDKSAFFLQQAKCITDMSKKIAPMKSQIYLIFGDIALQLNRFRESVKFFKKSLQYAWFFKQKESEIDAFEKLGISYFYLQDIKLSEFYYIRATQAQYEIVNSHIRNISFENINEYFNKCEYNLTSITPILMVHLSLPVQYSLDKLQQGIKETSLKQEQQLNKRNSHINEKLQILVKESQKQVENFVQSRQKIFNQSNATKIIDQLIEDNEFLFETDTPKQFEDITQDQTKVPQYIKNISDEQDSEQTDELIQIPASLDLHEQSKKKRGWEAPIMKLTSYDISKFGPIKDPIASKRVFEDISKYKVPIEKRIQILQKQKIDYSKIMEKVNYIVSSNQKYHEDINQRVRISHQSTNRFDLLRQLNTQNHMIKSIKRAYKQFLNQLKQAEQQIKQ